VPYLTHVLCLFALGSRVVDFVCFIYEHDGPDGVATKTESCATEDDNGYEGLRDLYPPYITKTNGYN
jgi:hypothetical protein